MAAPSKEHVKLSKQQRLARKKENKAKHVLFRHENITTVETPTRVSTLYEICSGIMTPKQ